MKRERVFRVKFYLKTKMSPLVGEMKGEHANVQITQ